MPVQQILHSAPRTLAYPSYDKLHTLTPPPHQYTPVQQVERLCRRWVKRRHLPGLVVGKRPLPCTGGCAVEHINVGFSAEIRTAESLARACQSMPQCVSLSSPLKLNHITEAEAARKHVVL